VWIPIWWGIADAPEIAETRVYRAFSTVARLAPGASLGRLRNGAQANLPEFSQAQLVKVFAGQSDLVGIARRVAGTLFQPVVVMG